MKKLNEGQNILYGLVKKDLNEATTSSSSSGRFTVPLSPGIRLFKNKQLAPFIVPTSPYDDAKLAYDSYDGSMDVSKKEADSIESHARKVSQYVKNHPVDNDGDGDIINQAPEGGSKIDEGKEDEVYKIIEEIKPIILKVIESERNKIMRNGGWIDDQKMKKKVMNRIMDGESDIFDLLLNKCSGTFLRREIERLKKLLTNSLMESKNEEISRIIKFVYPIISKRAQIIARSEGVSGNSDFVAKFRKEIVSKLKKGDEETFDTLYRMCSGMYKEQFRQELMNLKDIVSKNLNEDLAVWFGTKKKPKGSKQPKGPWVNICKKVDGKHPPCGRSNATDKAYPKCRAAGVAGKMTDSQKKSACAQKRKVEKSHPKSGTGNSPKMVSYNPKNK